MKPYRAVFALLVATSFAVPARAEILSLVCSYPKNTFIDISVDVDLAARSVSGYFIDRRINLTPAQITNYKITWTWDGTDFIIDRIGGQLVFCRAASCTEEPLTCQSKNTVKPKF